jgi:5-methylcytosine-specific restriction endonuclease McrA
LPGRDRNQIRRDQFGTLMIYSEYGKLTQYGWEIDHSWPSSLGGSDHASNLRAMHWRNNREKSNKPYLGMFGF